MFFLAKAAWNCSGEGYSHFDGAGPLELWATGQLDGGGVGASYGEASGAEGEVRPRGIEETVRVEERRVEEDEVLELEEEGGRERLKGMLFVGLRSSCFLVEDEEGACIGQPGGGELDEDEVAAEEEAADAFAAAAIISAYLWRSKPAMAFWLFCGAACDDDGGVAIIYGADMGAMVGR